MGRCMRRHISSLTIRNFARMRSLRVFLLIWNLPSRVLRAAALVSVRRDGRLMIYAAQYDTMNGLLGYLTDNCCMGAPDTCAPAAYKPTRAKRTKVSAS
jgi:hypothetical protein